MQSNAILFADLFIGQTYAFTVRFTERLINDFAALSGDKNPLHTDLAHAVGTPFDGKIAHGMLAGALFSRLVGMHLPGQYAVYLSQSLQFHKPIYPDSEVVVSGTIVQKSEGSRSVVMATEIRDTANRSMYVSGEARVRLLQ